MTAPDRPADPRADGEGHGDGDADAAGRVVPGRSFSLRERLYLTYKYHGLKSLLFRAITFPLRGTPLKRYLEPAPHRRRTQRAAARRWYRELGRPVTIVIASYRDVEAVAALVASLRKTTNRRLVRIVVTDDASGPEHLRALRALKGIEVIEATDNRGFAANVNRGLRAADPQHDVVILNSDMIARPGWLAGLQYATSRADDIGIVGAKLLYGDGTLQFAGTVRNLSAPEWFDHRYRFRAPDWGPANVTQTVLAVTGACMYLTRELIGRVGLFDEDYPMAYEDVDLCLRAWGAGFQVVYWPPAELEHHESITRGIEVGERERRSQRLFWQRWGEFFDARDVRTADGALRVVYVTEDTGVGGGHRDIFEHLNGLHARGHEAELWTLGGQPEWFDLHVPVRSFADYGELTAALTPVNAIKVATWWNTAGSVWRASVLNGIAVYFVQDIETSYYSANQSLQDTVLASYRHEFRYMTISSWNRERLRELGLEAVLIPPGIDLESFGPRPDIARRRDMILALGRSNPLKNLPLTIAAWRRLPEPRPELCLFGIEPELVSEPGTRYVDSPSDEQVNSLFNQATVFVQTSYHEGFCLPPLESMATGGAVVCTDAHGNRDFCQDGHNCLMPNPDVASVAAALGALLHDPDLRHRLGEAGRATAGQYGWDRRIDALERFLHEVAEPRTSPVATGAVPQPRRLPAR